MKKEITKINEYENTNKIMRNKKVMIGLLLVIIFIYVVYIVVKLIQNPTDTCLVENGTLYEEETLMGYLIREEEVIRGQNYKNGIVPIKTEGEKVSKGEPVFRYYSRGEEGLNEKIKELDQKIQETMSNTTDLFSSDIKNIEVQIEELLDEIYSTNDLQKIKEYKKDINNAITKKAKIAGELSPSGSYLKKLIDERSSYENKLNEGAEYSVAPKSGMVSYRVDGLEEVLSPNDFSVLSKEFLDGLQIKTGQMIASSEEAGKIINNFSCYIACTSDSEQAKKAQTGENVKLRLPSGTEIEASIEYITKEEKDNVLVLKITKGIDELIGYRKISFDLIWWDANGLKVPNSAIKEENQINYVMRNRAGYYDKIWVKVLKQNERYSIVTNYKYDELKELGITSDELKNRSTISLYDEISF